MRQLTNIEQNRVKILTENQISLTLIEPTATGLSKSIMDATGPIRSYLKENGIHNYDIQKQGPENKICIDASIYEEYRILRSTASLYRPKTKKGDPRIWFSGLTRIASQNDIIAIIYYQQKFHVFNLTRMDIGVLLNSAIANPFKELITEISNENNLISDELLVLLKKIAARGPIESMVAADTSVGRTLETALGIQINSSRLPDYKGIELKAFRGGRENRKNLFAQVPNWNLSKFKSSAEILNAFGYEREGISKLYCTVSTITRNSQGLSLKVDQDIKELIENSNSPDIGDFAVWALDTLHARLLEKHKETFWVKANCSLIDGKEYFQYTHVEHTKRPIISQFDLLLDQGIITVDHLIKKNTHGKITEKGPLFKIKSNGIDLLFPPSKKHDLI